MCLGVGGLGAPGFCHEMGLLLRPFGPHCPFGRSRTVGSCDDSTTGGRPLTLQRRAVLCLADGRLRKMQKLLCAVLNT